MPLELKSTEQFVTDEIAAINAGLPGQFQFPVGSYTRATVEAHARIGIWQESNIELVFSSIRLTTSIGNAVDTFLADFGLTRLPAIPASGNVTFSSVTFTTDRYISVGQTVAQRNNICSYEVITDISNEFWDGTQYKIPSGTQEGDIPVVAVTAGIIGNCQVNAITVINSPIVGIDSISNALSFTNGVNTQTDPQAKAYFLTYINSLSRATESSWAFAVEIVPDVTEFTIQENLLYPGLTVDLGRGFAVIDDGSGTPSDDLVAAVLASLALYRGLAIRFDVYKPVLIHITALTVTVTLPPNFSDDGLSGAIEFAIESYVLAIPFGETLFYSRVIQIIYNTILDRLSDQSLFDQFNVSSLLINGATADITSTVIQKFIVDDNAIDITYA